jgi:uncharacterized protein YjbJ (UPF0337 family)
MKSKIRNVLKGAGREVKGKVNEAAGRISGKPGLRAKGRLQQAGGRVQRKFGEAQHEIEKEDERQRTLTE